MEYGYLSLETAILYPLLSWLCLLYHILSKKGPVQIDRTLLGRNDIQIMLIQQSIWLF